MDVIGRKTVEGPTYCSECEASLHHHNPIPSETHTHSNQVLGWVFSDVCEVETVTHEGFKYFITFIDDFSHHLVVYPMKNKSDALKKFKEYLTMVEQQTDSKLKIFCTNGGGNYFLSKFSAYLKRIGIIHEKTNPWNLQENSIAERVNRTLVTMTITMLKSVESKVGCTAWPYAIQHAALIKNISPPASLPDGISPHERYMGNKPNVSMICTFSCKATLHIHCDLHQKLDDCSIPSIHLGIPQGKKAFLVYNPKTHKVHELRDIHFVEDKEDVSECVTIQVESVDSPSHVVVPVEGERLVSMDDGLSAFQPQP